MQKEERPDSRKKQAAETKGGQNEDHALQRARAKGLPKEKHLI
jgi:hypothetical protein